MPSWRVNKVTLGACNGPVFHVEKDGKHFEYRISKLTRNKIQLICCKKNCKSRLNLDFGGVLKTEKVGSVFKWTEDSVIHVTEKNNYADTIVHHHTRRNTCQITDSNEECLIVRHASGLCSTLCSSDLKRKFTTEVKKIAQVNKNHLCPGTRAFIIGIANSLPSRYNF